MNQELKQEALNRLKSLKLHPNVSLEYMTTDTVYYSEDVRLGAARYGILYWLSNEPKWEEIVKEVEEKVEGHVYHVIHSHTVFGEILSMLYVSNDAEDWERDHTELAEGLPLAYVYNLSEPEFSELGVIGIKEVGGGLIRTE